MNIKGSRPKVVTDILSMILTVAAIVTGFMLHRDVWHIHNYGNTSLWSFHEAVGLALTVLVILHGIQHSFWFKNYARIKVDRKRVTTIFLILGTLLALTGIILMCGSQSETVSHIHYFSGILFTAVAIGHVAKRWKIFKSLA